MVTDRLYQVVIDTNRNIVARKCSFATRTIAALPREKGTPLDLCRERNSYGIALFEECTMQTFKRFFTNPAIIATDVNPVIPFFQLDIFAFLLFNMRKFHIGI